MSMILSILWLSAAASGATDAGGARPLPKPTLTGRMSVEEAIQRRRSVREFAETPLTKEQVGQLCWAAQGITDRERRLRAAPSAGALYPIELYLVTAEALDHYIPRQHALERRKAGDIRPDIQRAALQQESLGSAPLCVVITAVVERSARKYQARAERYCLLEAGHVAENILLQATALGLGGVPVGAFDDEQVAAVLKPPKGERVLYLLPIGHPRP